MTIEPVNLLQVILASVAALSALLTIHRQRLRALTALMLLACLWMVFNYLEETTGFRDIHLVTPAFRLAYPPLFFLLTRGLIFAGASLSWRDWPHALPFLTGLAMTTTALDWVEAAARLSVIAYALAVVWLLVRYQRTIRTTRSDAETIGLRWMYAALAVYLADEAFDIARMDLPGLHTAWPWLATPDAYFASLFGSLILTIGLVYLAIRHHALFDGLVPGSLDTATAPPDGTTDAAEPDFRQLDLLVRREALYTEPRLTLAEVAVATGLTPRQASTAIRNATGRTFNAYINALRVEDVCGMMAGAHDQQGADTVLDMAYTAGFSSKSVFNAWFKRETGHTPSGYRASLAG
ncbi:helix-turn-helix domain-containing protein [Maricaulis sp. CAU 1757]